MKKIVLMISIFCGAVLAISCNEGEKKALLTGEWRGAEWLINGHASAYDVNQVYFNFGKDDRYNSDFGGDKEKGSYIIRDDKLYTTPDDELEIMVKIEKLTKDSLVFDMNRSGQSEKLTLVRK
ncbi:MAG: hypothetical protein JWN78_464 [Bacteroidota bacterium]|nr:hypothetical protein [Bacteroidota bacterium]